LQTSVLFRPGTLESTGEYFKATENLANLVGKHEDFAEAKRYAERMREKRRTGPFSSRTTLGGTLLPSVVFFERCTETDSSGLPKEGISVFTLQH